jgi:cellulose synthase/poly-beta-1,6-N-acetylglucosamine synthase-like glycosyltransferase
VSLVFAAHNEAAVIEEKLRNCAALAYPAERLEVLIGCDACTDNTVPLARAAGISNVQVFDFVQRGGKPSVLNRLMPFASGDLVVFCDANTLFERDTIHRLVRHFTRPDVGCVCGELRLRSAPEGNVEGVYWKYETLLKFLESRMNMLLGANGGVFAIRRQLFRPIPSTGIIDDFLIAMQVRSVGYRIIYDPEAVAWEEAPPNIRHEFRRRVRIGAGNFSALRYTWKLLLPSAGAIAFSYWSHKVCRWLAPVALCSGMVAAVFLAAQPLYAAWAALGVLLIALASAGYRLETRGKHRRLFSIPYYFLSMNLALLLGMFRFLRGSQTLVWNPTVRTGADVDEKEVRGSGAPAA